VAGESRLAVSDPGALTGAMVAGGFGIAWALWSASGLTDGAAAAVRVGGVVIGVVILLGSAVVQRRARRAAGSGTRGGGSSSLFAAPGYRLVVVCEVIALVIGGLVLGWTGHSEYAVAWYAFVVGVHFVVLGRLFWGGFYSLGAGLLAAGLAGAIVGLTGGGASAIRAVSALTAAVSLFVAGGWAMVAQTSLPG